MKNYPLISVALATYNGEAFLRQQLDSIYTQSYCNLEVIAVDDCSNDGTVDILREYSENYGLELYVNKTNLGFKKNFEKVLSLCRGDYVALADQDDIWLTDKLETLINEIKDYSLICSDASLVDEEGNIIANSMRRHSNVYVPQKHVFEFLVFDNYVTGCTTLIDAKILEKSLPIPETETYHDWWLALQATRYKGIKYIDKSLVHYRQHEKNQIGAQNKRRNVKLFRLFSKMARHKKMNDVKSKIQRLENVLSYDLKLSQDEYSFLLDSLEYYSFKDRRPAKMSVVMYIWKYHSAVNNDEKVIVKSIKTLWICMDFIASKIKNSINGRKV